MQLALDCGAMLTAFRSAKDFEKVASEMVADVSVSKYLQLRNLILSRLCSSMRSAQRQIGKTSVQRSVCATLVCTCMSIASFSSLVYKCTPPATYSTPARLKFIIVLYNLDH